MLNAGLFLLLHKKETTTFSVFKKNCQVMFEVDTFTLNQSAPTPGKATRLREVKSEDVGGLGWAGIGADGEGKVGGRQHPEGNCTKPRMICLFYRRLFVYSIAGFFSEPF